MRLLSLLAALLLALPALAFTPPPWTRSANIYEVNVRQFSRDSSFNAVTAEIPRLQKMGVKILWIMPIQPIGVKERKGELGSYYAVRDYKGINPEFGTLDDFKRLVATAHAHDMKVVLDWVANHTAWDSAWVTQHPDWYQKNAQGQISGYVYDNGTSLEHWDDVVGLDYRNKTLWPAMIDAMRYWVDVAGIDGFRADVAGRVPVPFWVAARTALDARKPLFWLAEGDAPDLAQAFDMVYDWDFAHLMQKVAKGKASAADLAAYVEHPRLQYAPDTYRMRFTSNHDFNSWAGSDPELYGAGFKAFAVLAATLPDMPLIYGGQEASLNKRLEFFKRDPIDWHGASLADFYAGLLRLKTDNKALWNGTAGGKLVMLATGNTDVIAYDRVRDGNRIRVIANLSGKPAAFSIEAKPRTLAAWDYAIAVD
ncbi:alpha-amylase family glycosyl hydrolase [Polymorphobacter arshaanensis]|nr:alpha-amylase family glycosyl hydrolase [Polymorphobacter arshaanensis]